MSVQISIDDMVHIFGDTYIPNYWIKDLKKEARKENVITQKEAIIALKKLKFQWCEDSEEYLFDNDNMDWSSLIRNFGETIYDFLMCGADMTGSPGHDEIFILNLLAIAYPVVPFNIIKQAVHGPLKPPLMSRKHGILLKKENSAIVNIELYGEKYE